METTPEIRRQRAYRARRTAKLAKLEQGHHDILTALGDKTGPVAVQIRALAEKALA